MKGQGGVYMTDIGKNIRTVRKQRGLSQAELADRLNVTRQTVSNWETSRSYPDLDMLVRLSQMLETDPNALLYPQKGQGKMGYRPVSLGAGFAAMAFFFFVMTVFGGGIAMLFQSIVGGGVEQSYLYPIYGGIIMLAGLVVFCTCTIVGEIPSYKLFELR